MADWTDAEIEAVVSEYFRMLDAEAAGQDYVKREANQRVQNDTGRSRGAVEYKFQNVSAVLEEAGLSWIPGYKPASNYQAALRPAVLREAERRGMSPTGEYVSTAIPQRRLALLLGANPLETLDVYQSFLRKRGIAVWRTKDRRSREWIDAIPFPLTLYFFYLSKIRYRATCIGISSADPYGLEAIPPEFHDDATDYSLFVAITELKRLDPLPISCFEKWDRPGEHFERGQQGILKVVDPF